MIHLFMISLESSAEKDEIACLFEVLQKAYVGIETLANGFQNNFFSLVQQSVSNKVMEGLLAKHFLGSVNEILKTKSLVFVALKELSLLELAGYSLAGDALKLKLHLLNIKLLRLEKNYYDYSKLSEAIDLMDAITDLLAILEKLSHLVVHVFPLIDALQMIQSLLKEISRA